MIRSRRQGLIVEKELRDWTGERNTTAQTRGTAAWCAVKLCPGDQEQSKKGERGRGPRANETSEA